MSKRRLVAILLGEAGVVYVEGRHTFRIRTLEQEFTSQAADLLYNSQESDRKKSGW